MNSLVLLWKEPFPLASTSRQIRFSLLLGLAVWLVLQILQPFRLNEVVNRYFDIKLLGYGLLTSTTSILYTSIWRSLFPSMFQEKNWTLGVEILVIASNVLVIGLANLLYSSLVFKIPLTVSTLMFFQFATLAVGFIPITLITLLKYSLLMRKVSAESRLFNAEIPRDNMGVEARLIVEEIISLPSENKNEQMRLSPLAILGIESADNYVMVYFVEEGQVKKNLLRSSLMKMEEVLAGYPGIIRTHRSWLVNLHYTGQASGNAQGLLLHIPVADLWVPVARSRVAEIKVRLAQSVNNTKSIN